MRIVTLFPRYCADEAVSHTCFQLVQWVRSEELDHRLVIPAGAEHVVDRPFVRTALGRAGTRCAYRLGLEGWASRRAERAFWRELRRGDAAVVWPGVRPEVTRKLKERGHTLFTERINCHRAVSRRILEEAYLKIGLPPNHRLRPEDEAVEREELELVDYVFSPSPFVTASLVEQGVPARKILASSYGWDPSRIAARAWGEEGERGKEEAQQEVFGGRGPVFLYVGRICVRKGAHLLLRAWAESGKERGGGRLVLVGRLDDDVRMVCERELMREDVVLMGHTPEVGRLYAAADVFVLPTLEEGSALVVYEALAAGLPVVTTAMGAGEVVRDGVEGRVVDAHGRAELGTALRSLAADEELRRAMGLCAAERARQYTWSKVGARRAELVVRALRQVGAHEPPVRSADLHPVGMLAEPALPSMRALQGAPVAGEPA